MMSTWNEPNYSKELGFNLHEMYPNDFAWMLGISLCEFKQFVVLHV